jgi:hypothetical protein
MHQLKKYRKSHIPNKIDISTEEANEEMSSPTYGQKRFHITEDTHMETNDNEPSI